jgi:hypothetical protein
MRGSDVKPINELIMTADPKIFSHVRQHTNRIRVKGRNGYLGGF